MDDDEESMGGFVREKREERNLFDRRELVFDRVYRPMRSFHFHLAEIPNAMLRYLGETPIWQEAEWEFWSRYSGEIINQGIPSAQCCSLLDLSLDSWYE